MFTLRKRAFTLGLLIALPVGLPLQCLATESCARTPIVNMKLFDTDDVQQADGRDQESATERTDVPKLQKAQVEIDVVDPSVKMIDEITASAADKDRSVQDIRKKLARFSNKMAMLKQRSNDILNSMFMFKGVSMSSEAGDVILDEKNKLDSLGAAKYAAQEVLDGVELKTLAAYLQTAAVVGDSKSNASDIQQAKSSLASIVGDDEAEKAMSYLSSIEVAPARDVTPSDLSVPRQMQKAEDALIAAAPKDPIVGQVQVDVHKFNQHSQLVYGLHRMIRVTLCVASLAPNVVGPISQGVLLGYVVLSGGSEQSKVFKELYMDKRLTCRATTLREEVHLAFDNYKTGLLTKNALLMDCSEGLLARLTDPATAARLVSPDGLPKDELAKVVSSANEKNEQQEAALEAEDEAALKEAGRTQTQ